MRAFFLLLTALTPVCGAAQMADIVPGMRIRVSATDLSGRIEGTVATRTVDSIVVVTPAPAQYHIAVASITSMAVSKGRTASQGAMKGALWGGGIGLVLTLPLSWDSSKSSHPPNYGVMLVEGTVVDGMIGAGIGALVRAEEWTSYDLPARISVNRNGARVGASFSF
jgi:hypothetical protein